MRSSLAGFPMDSSETLGNKKFDRMPHQLVAAVSGHPSNLPVCVGDHAVAVHDDDAVWHPLQKVVV